MKIRVLSESESFVHALSAVIEQRGQVAAASPTFVPGATESLWQLAVDFGAVSLPLSVAGNLIASWIWEAKRKSKEPFLTTLDLKQMSKVKLVVFAAGKPAEIQIESDDLDAIRAAVETAIQNVDQQR